MQGMTGSESALIVPTHANNTAEAQPILPVQKALHPELTAPVVGPPAPEPSRHPEQSQLSDQPEHPKQPEQPEAKGKVQGKVLIMEDRAMNLFSFDSAAGQAFAEAINHIQTRLEQSLPYPVQTTVLLAPTAVEFIQSAKLKSLSDSEKEAIHEVYGRIRKDVAKTDALSSLGSHTEEPLYFRTDHHWTATGAYYAYGALTEAMGIKPVPLTSYEQGEVPEYLGSLYSATMNRKLAAHPDTIVYYKPIVPHRYFVHYTGSMEMPLIDLSHATKKNKYRIFLSGDRPWGQITTQIDNHRKLLVIKDSYGNALVPFLLPHYSEIFVVDPRQFNQPLIPFIQKHDIREMLFINNAEVLMDQSFAELLRRLVAD
jgi:hypothetical protein